MIDQSDVAVLPSPAATMYYNISVVSTAFAESGLQLPV
jgi:hypothetical protein